MPDRIPIQAAKDVAEKHGCKQVILMAWDGEKAHVVTYGKTLEDCYQAALGGDRIKKALGWPESLNAEPSRVKKLKAEIAELKSKLEEYSKPS